MLIICEDHISEFLYSATAIRKRIIWIFYIIISFIGKYCDLLVRVHDYFEDPGAMVNASCDE